MNLASIGTTGLIGRHCLEQLAREPLFTTIYSLSRRPLDVKGKGIDERVGPMQDLGLLLRDAHFEQALCCLGTTIKQAGSEAAFAAVDRDLALAFARQAKERGARTFHVVSSLGADRRSSNFYLRTKGELEAGLEALDFAGLHIYRPSLLLGSREQRRLGEEITARASAWFKPFFRGPLLAYKPIEAASVASFIIAQMRNPKEGRFVWENRLIHDGARA